MVVAHFATTEKFYDLYLFFFGGEGRNRRPPDPKDTEGQTGNLYAYYYTI